MATVNERETIVVVEPRLKLQSRTTSSTGPRGPTEPPALPPGGGGGGKIPHYVFILLVIAFVPFGLTLRTCLSVLGDSGALKQ